MRPLLLALAVVATPALAQSVPEEAVGVQAVEEAPVDQALVGEWTLDTVVEPGVLGDYGVEIQDMTCAFSASGQARVSMKAVQDGDPMERAREFTFETEDGQIVAEDDDGVGYRLLDDGGLELIEEGGLVIRLVRADA